MGFSIEVKIQLLSSINITYCTEDSGLLMTSGEVVLIKHREDFSPWCSEFETVYVK